MTSIEIQIVELHFSQLPRCDYALIKRRTEAILSDEIDANESKDESEVYLLIHKNHPIRFSDGQVPAQTAILAAHQPINLTSYASEIQQSWAFRDCEKVLKNSSHTLLVTELMARLLPPDDRIRLFHGVLQALIEITQPDALVFKHTQQVIRPEDYMNRVTDAPILRPGALNIRFFNISNSDGDMLMDTRGLTEIGLHDLQCHFRNLDPNDVGSLLFNTALYIFENGPVIESGNTVAGITPGSKWVCQFENALVEPEREVLDLNPGAPFAAGGRQ